MYIYIYIYIHIYNMLEKNKNCFEKVGNTYIYIYIYIHHSDCNYIKKKK